MKVITLILGFCFLIGCEILLIYFIMPFPGSQEDESIQLAYLIHGNIWYLRALGILLVAYPAYSLFRKGLQTTQIIIGVVIIFYGFVFYTLNFLFLADKMFLQPKNKSFAVAAENKVPESQLVLGVAVGNQSKAYPIRIIGYHHQVRDTVAGQPIMVTYCTVCRAGRVYDPQVDGRPENFRLVGMDHYNAMFEDQTTKSWWRQVNGTAIIGHLKGKQLLEIPAEQMTLANWINLHPQTLIMQPDTLFNDAYEQLEDYDEGNMAGRLESKDSVSWRDKSWVVGVQVGSQARAYDWVELQNVRLVEDTLDSLPILVAIDPDSATFHVFNRIVKADTLSFSMINDGQNLSDKKTKSVWNWNGRCVEGELSGYNLIVIQSYQEYWHSWRMFRGDNAYLLKTASAK